ncbi:hypothetical protein OJ997_01855 [Solirubrobacter phytolaccae]|uniref:Uncharacterized protein n=1 Tax=Solirubrobacter phytolaccae TaxID=1404360 RepID=A0A9X3N3G8_9ACTN|nr:hypothetical protein [Solirubrobacter phytolaccae]MDA0179023.1 hypothetical protein [Solirubrobacter phytolaccae]
MRVAAIDTTAAEDVNGAEVRRLVFAGDPVPDNWQVDADALAADEPAPSAPATDVFDAMEGPELNEHLASRGLEQGGRLVDRRRRLREHDAAHQD